MGLVIWGEGRELENFIFELETNHKNADVECIATSGDYYFLNRYTVKGPSEFPVRKNMQFDSKIVIAVSDADYPARKTQLETMGYREFDDFIGYRMYAKKVCVINANCYLSFIKRFLNENTEFRKVYGIYPLPAIHENKFNYIGDNILAHADLYIHQDIRPDNVFGYKFSDEYTLSKLKSDCKSICIPNFVGMLDGFYPTVTGQMYNNVNGEPMCFDDWLINEAYQKYNGNIENIMFYIMQYYFDDEDIIRRFNTMVLKWRERENNWDVKVVDFIMDNYQKIPLFEDISHPAECLQHEICRRLIKLIGCADTNKFTHYHMGCCMEIFMWPQVKEILEIKWSKEQIRLYTKDYCYHDGQPITMKQYVEEYIWRVFGNR